ncbi:hypothetical protein [Variovorax sp. tm]|uniref:hypothetical protein n=1 Tax=Variovorax atrisoli TaxID=3394203 RepID=UPI003A7FF1AB
MSLRAVLEDPEQSEEGHERQQKRPAHPGLVMHIAAPGVRGDLMRKYSAAFARR